MEADKQVTRDHMTCPECGECTYHEKTPAEWLAWAKDRPITGHVGEWAPFLDWSRKTLAGLFVAMKAYPDSDLVGLAETMQSSCEATTRLIDKANSECARAMGKANAIYQHNYSPRDTWEPPYPEVCERARLRVDVRLLSEAAMDTVQLWFGTIQDKTKQWERQVITNEIRLTFATLPPKPWPAGVELEPLFQPGPPVVMKEFRLHTMDSIPSLSNLVGRFAHARDWQQFHTPRNLIFAIASEVGELAECYQWTSDGDPTAREKAVPEMADVLIYLLRLASVLDVDLAQAVRDKVKLNETRYPVELSRGTAKKYTELGG